LEKRIQSLQSLLSEQETMIRKREAENHGLVMQINQAELRDTCNETAVDTLKVNLDELKTENAKLMKKCTQLNDKCIKFESDKKNIEMSYQNSIKEVEKLKAQLEKN